MRLTLRTLLAYLDDALEEDQLQVLQQKLADSDVAKDLAGKIQDAISDPMIPAMNPLTSNPTGDINQVSDYIDNTIPPRQVSELEQKCLDSRILLSEVAGCHQILTRMLAQQADVSPELRKRIQGIVSQQAGVSIPDDDSQPISDIHVPMSNGSTVISEVGRDDSGAFSTSASHEEDDQSGKAMMHGPAETEVFQRARPGGQERNSQDRSARQRSKESQRDAAWRHGAARTDVFDTGGSRTSISLVVCLGVLAVFGFAIAQAAWPLLNGSSTLVREDRTKTAIPTRQDNQAYEDADPDEILVPSSDGDEEQEPVSITEMNAQDILQAQSNQEAEQPNQGNRDATSNALSQPMNAGENATSVTGDTAGDDGSVIGDNDGTGGNVDASMPATTQPGDGSSAVIAGSVPLPGRRDDVDDGPMPSLEKP
ncbi:MAG: hypothetical protein AAFP69_08845, partial [Planctomycetota bacterium]